MNLTEEQQAILQQVPASDGNWAVSALAGTGKTWICCQLAQNLPAGAMFTTFAKPMAQELQKRLPGGQRAGTFHSLCKTQLSRAGLYNKRGAVDTSKLAKIARSIAPADDPDFWQDTYPRLRSRVGLLKANGVLTEQDWDRFLPVVETQLGDDPLGEDDLRLLQALYTESISPAAETIDFDDMLLYALRVPSETFPWLVVDEAQDLNRVQRLLLARFLGAQGQLLAVGDPNQAIFAFRGADYHSMARISEVYRCAPAVLTTSFRCAPAIIAEAQKLVPALRGLPGPPGLVEHIEDSSLGQLVRPGDIVICRTNRPMISAAASLLQQGIPAKLVRTDLSKKAATLQQKIAKAGWTLPAGIPLYAAGACKALRDAGQDRRAGYLEEDCATLSALWEHFGAAWEEIFTTPGRCVLFMTIHGAKGLEADRVFLLRPDLLPHPAARTAEELQQERNLQYVAITRARHALYYTHASDNGC